MTTTTSDYVKLDRAAAKIVFVLNLDGRELFVEAVRSAGKITSVAQPYRAWFKDPNKIPDEYRKTPLVGKDLTEYVR